MSSKRIMTIVLSILISTFIVMAVRELMTTTPLTKKEMTAQVETMYEGSVLSLIEQDRHYIASFKKQQSIYEVHIDSLTGAVSNLTAIHVVQAEKPLVNTTPTNEPPQLTARLSEQKAIDIALKEVPGELDSVDFEQTNDGGQYLIEIEQQEFDVTIHLHAITGEILSIQYDD